MSELFEYECGIDKTLSHITTEKSVSLHPDEF
jgi:hypothetical protein